MKNFTLLLLISLTNLQVQVSGKISFNKDIQPILSSNCYSCHGPDSESREADLRLDTREGAIMDLGGYRAVDPGKPEESEIILRIESDDQDEVMPPPESGHAISSEQLTLLKEWIENGAEYETHWSFKTPHKQLLPDIKRKEWPLSPIDHFVLKKLETENLPISKDASKRTWIRRVFLDITGLPPTIEQAEKFHKDQENDAYEKVVDHLLASDTYGEHWARMWLDLARFADTKGYEKDLHRDMWRYRDWVIKALNEDMPYDQFTIEQIAGDMLPNPSPDQILATAFHRNTMENDEGGTDDEEFRIAAVKDRVDTTIQVWMGLTMGCAKCHTHKYDPISIQDYYSFYAMFNQTEDADRVTPIVPTPTSEQARQQKEIQKKISQLQISLQEKPETFQKDLDNWKGKFKNQPLWEPFTLVKTESKHGVILEQGADGTLQAKDENPEKDTWTLTLSIPDDTQITSIRIDTFPKKSGGKWIDKNVALREISAEWRTNDDETKKVNLINPRADFSQNGWEVAKAIDGNKNVGWAFSPRSDQPHVAIFDIQNPIKGGNLKLTLEQEFGQGLLFESFRISFSTYPVEWLKPVIDYEKKFNLIFEEQVFAKTRNIHDKIKRETNALNSLKSQISKTPIMRELPQSKLRPNTIHQRGNFLDPGKDVNPEVLTVFGKIPSGYNADRLGAAHWLMSKENPLTSRVMVNRVWARLFGTGIVETEEDFGSQGMHPSHPDLLDWLAVDYQENGWSLKKLLKSIVLSRTYRQSSIIHKDALQKDPRNRLLGRGPRFRLTAEMLRDQSLFASGLLTQKIGGPSVMPPQPPGVWKSTYSGAKWSTATGPDRYRRGLYTYIKRTSPHPAMITFDAGTGEVCQVRRIRTNTPLQALITLNDQAYMEAAGNLSNQMLNYDAELSQQIAHGFQRLLTRPPEKKELQRLISLYHQLEEEIIDKDDYLQSAGLKEGNPAMVALASVLLNLDETLTKP